MTDMTDENTLAEVQEWIVERADEGVACPCCEQFVKIYDKRKITGNMARVLVEMYRRNGAEWADLPHICNDLGIGSRGDQTASRRWGLIEKHPSQRDDGGPSVGLWRLTPTGLRFVRNETTVFKYARVYNNEVLRLHGAQVTIADCLPSGFNYTELMSTPPTQEEA